ncbi:hypothetical protein OEZ86_002138 [Tetradesmus obliquus]|nr:hypothetical protein OEZ86_002138 [Tetradesmus obliquus]
MLNRTPPSSGVRPVAAQRQAAACLLLFRQPHLAGWTRRAGHVPHATRDTSFAYQQDIQTKLKPGDFADRIDDKRGHLADAPDWPTVLRLFAELGENSDRNVGLVGDMLVSLQRLLPPGAAGAGAAGAARLSAQDAKQVALGVSGMCDVLLNNITRVNNKLLINIVWALALLPDPSKALQTPAAAAARARAVGGFGAAVITRMPKLTAEEVFHVCAGLALAGFKPPRTLTRQVQQRPADGADGAAAAAAAGSSSSSSMKFGALLERRSLKVMHYMSPKTIADAGFVMSRLVAPGDVSAEWLALYAKISKQQLAAMQPEALIYSGYAFARHGYLPSNSWRKSYLRGLQGAAKSLAGEEFPLALFMLARWRQQEQQGAAGVQQQQQQQTDSDAYEEEDDEEYEDANGYADQWSSGGAGGSSSDITGTDPPQALIDDLLFASHSNRALRELPLSQLVVMVKALAELQATVNPLWVQRLWPLINAKIDAAVAAEPSSSSSSSSSGAVSAAGSLAGDLAALLAAIPRLQPMPRLPADFLDNILENFSVEDFMELFIVIADAQLQQQVPRDLLDAAAEALAGALAPKGPEYGFGVSPSDAADLMLELVNVYGYALPSKVKSRYKKGARVGVWSLYRQSH